MRALFIINPAAGANRALARWKAFESLLDQSAIQLDRVFTGCPGDAAQLACKAASSYQLLVAVGGDGTVAEVASGILSARPNRAALGILPLGTGNDVAEVMGIRPDTGIALNFETYRTVNIDVLQIECQKNGNPTVRYALLFAGVGIISDSLRKTTPKLKRFFGQRLAYPAGLVHSLCKYRSPQMTVTCDEQVFQDRFLFVGASNTTIAGGGMKIAPGAKLDDGLLNINLIGAVSGWRALLLLRRVCQGRHTKHPKVRFFTARRLEISSPADLEVAADGDLIGHTPARVEVQANALRVLVPGKRE
jgi:diacylglycerol kinase (ATP)